MTPVNYLSLGPLVLLVVFGIAAPHISALLTAAPSYLTGVLTTLVAAVGGFLSQLVQQDHGYDWKRGLYNALLAWLLGLATHLGWVQGPAARALHSVGPQLGSKRHPRPGRNDGGYTNVGGIAAFVLLLIIVLLAFKASVYFLFFIVVVVALLFI